MRVTSIVPLYRGREVIADCIRSLSGGQEGVEVSVVVVDDGSPDGAGDYVADRFPDVTIIRNDRNLGYAASVNRGIREASGEFLLLLNQDTIVLPGAIRILAEELDSDPGLAAAAPQLIDFNGRVERSCRMLPTHFDVISHHLLLAYLAPESKLFGRWKMLWFDHDYRRFVEQPAFSAILLRRSTVERAGLLDERFTIFFNDVDYCKRIADDGGRILFSPPAKVKHMRGQATSQIPFRKIINSHLGFIRYFLKHYRNPIYWIPNILVILLLIASGVLRLLWQAIKRPFV